jgi:pyruvate kinase
MISRFKPPAWIIALGSNQPVNQGLAFSYGVHPSSLPEEPDNWRSFATGWLREQQIPGSIAMLVAGPSPRDPNANHRIEFLRVDESLTASHL